VCKITCDCVVQEAIYVWYSDCVVQDTKAALMTGTEGLMYTRVCDMGFYEFANIS